MNPSFRDAHALVMPLQDETGAAGEVRARFPFGARLDAHGKLRLRSSWLRSGDQRRLDAGTEISHINGEPVGPLLEDLARYSHGETQALQRHMLGLLFPHWLYAVRGWHGDFSMQLIDDGTARTIEIAPGADWTPQGTAGSAEPRLDFIEGGIGWLRIPSFDVDEDPEAYRKTIDGLFAQLGAARPAGLVIDVRGNTGGQSDAGERIIRYLADAPVSQASRARERLNAGNNGLFGWRGHPGTMREIDLSRHGRIDPAPEGQRWRGRTVLLVDGMTYSAGILFTTTLQDHGLATLVGRPTGGFGNQTGNMAEVVLPNTGLVAYIPEREFVRPSGDTRIAPVQPDLEVDESLSDAGDPILACAIWFLHEDRDQAAAGPRPAGCGPSV